MTGILEPRTPTTIHSLPEDVLFKVFTLLVDKYSDSWTALRDPIGVCRRWRGICIFQPLLWSRVDFRQHKCKAERGAQEHHHYQMMSGLGPAPIIISYLRPSLAFPLDIMFSRTVIANLAISLLSPLLLGLVPAVAGIIRPKVMIINMFVDEANALYNIPEFNLLAQNITVLGFSPLYPAVHCTYKGDICQLVTGEAEINAASTMTSLLFSKDFDLTSTYFLIAGIAGINPKHATLGSVTFARYAVQVCLQEEFDAREKPRGFPSGYIPQGATAPNQYPVDIYGTEVFEVNDRLRKIAAGFALKATLNDTLASQRVRAHYGASAAFGPGSMAPSIVLCDTATSDTYWSGGLLGEMSENTTRLFTNGIGVYCSTQQEDNGTLNALLRGALHNIIDFSRIIIMRTAAAFDRPFPGESAANNLLGPDSMAGWPPSLVNLHLAGAKVVQGIVDGWKDVFEKGVEPENYVGDIFGSLGSQPDFGPQKKEKL